MFRLSLSPGSDHPGLNRFYVLAYSKFAQWVLVPLQGTLTSSYLRDRPASLFHEPCRYVACKGKTPSTAFNFKDMDREAISKQSLPECPLARVSERFGQIGPTNKYSQGKGQMRLELSHVGYGHADGVLWRHVRTCNGW